MRPTILLLTLLLTYATSLNAQSLISEFDWNGHDVKKAKAGPHASRHNPHVGLAKKGKDNTTGLGVTKPSNGNKSVTIDYQIPGFDFNVDGLEVSIEFRAGNTTGNGDFFTRLHTKKNQAPVFSFGIRNYKLQVRYTLADGSVVELRDIATVPNDEEFRFYSFRYIPESGEAEVYMGTELVAYKATKPGVALNWSNAGDAFIGHNMSVVNTDNARMAKKKEGYTATFDNFTATSIRDQSISPMPVEFAAVNALATQHAVQINWATASELNNDFFTVERSQNGSSFEAIATVKGAGSSLQTLSYSVTDNSPLAGTSYYRVKQTDYDGTYKYSKVVAVEVSSPRQVTVEVYPTQVQNQPVSLVMNGTKTLEEVAVQIISLSGKVVSSKKLGAEAAAYGATLIETGELRAGTYIVLLSHAGNTYRNKLIVK